MVLSDQHLSPFSVLVVGGDGPSGRREHPKVKLTFLNVTVTRKYSFMLFVGETVVL